MALQIVEAKVQSVIISRTVMVALKCGPGKDKAVERIKHFKIAVGTYLEFNDACTIIGPDGRRHQGKGTVARFNFKHGTWSVQRPQRCETSVMGYVFTLQGQPCWLRPQRESGLTPLALKRDFSAAFVKLCLAGHTLAEANGAALRRSTLKAAA